MKKSTSWSTEEKNILLKNFRKKTSKEIAELLPNRTHSAVKGMLRRLGLKRTREEILKNRLRFIPNRRPQEHIEFIKQNMNEMTSRQMAEAIGKDKLYVSNVLSDLREQGIRISEEAKARFARESQFKKGHVPFNKGKKGVRYSPETEFKKGHTPANTLHNGAIRLRSKKDGSEQYYYIRIAKMKWIPYHRYLWQKNNGTIPKGKLVAFKDGNSLNCVIDNLELITRAENARRNRDPEKMSIAMKKLWREGHHLKSDHYVASLLTRDPQLQEIIKNNPELLDLKRAQLKQRRIIKDATTSTDD